MPARVLDNRLGHVHPRISNPSRHALWREEIERIEQAIDRLGIQEAPPGI